MVVSENWQSYIRGGLPGESELSLGLPLSQPYLEGSVLETCAMLDECILNNHISFYATNTSLENYVMILKCAGTGC